MENKNKEPNRDELDEIGQDAYNIIKVWIKNIPNTIADIKANGTNQDLHDYKIQIKMVLDKLEDIVKDMKTSD